ncbi:MAG: quinoprotein dehydrogenase-associated transporter substrate-binding protein [Gemmatimonadetes bacterium]|nr:quinoprotein dehydrogenase-associated transporter substrate-binding protein [Gemmatimonadota bacterium]
MVLLATLPLSLALPRAPAGQTSRAGNITGTPARVLRVCADPNNLPFSNEKQQGFENRIAELVAREMNAELRYTWWAQRRGYIRNSLRAGLCDLFIGMPTGLDMVLVTRPYYRSIYAFVTRRSAPRITSLDDPRLRRLRVGVQIIGDDFANAPPAEALTHRGIVRNVRGYTVLGDYREPNPPSRIVRAVSDGEIDVAIVWGPLAGYFARKSAVPLRVVPVSPEVDVPYLPFAFDIAMGVRHGETALRDSLDAVLMRRRGDIDRILADYGVPRADTPAMAGRGTH